MVAAKRVKGEARAPRYYPAYDIKAKAEAAPLKPTVFRPSLTPGTVLIVVAGRFRGKRCIMLKTLEKSGTIVVTGPYAVNGVPIRRVNPAYVIATSTKVDLSSIEIPSKLDDAYFKRSKPAKTEKKKKDEESEFFSVDEDTSTTPVISEERKEDQVSLDNQLLPIIEQKPMLKEYLGALFTLTKGMKPHEMKW